MAEDEKQPLLNNNEPLVVTNTSTNCCEQLTNPRCLLHRILVLTLMCFLSFGMFI